MYAAVVLWQQRLQCKQLSNSRAQCKNMIGLGLHPSNFVVIQDTKQAYHT